MAFVETFELTVRRQDPSHYEWFLAREGRVVERGAEPDLTFCLAAAALGLAPAAAVDIEYQGAAAGTYTAAALQLEPSAIADRVVEAGRP